MNPDSSWHHRTEPTQGDPSTGMVYCDFTLLQGEGPLHVRVGGEVIAIFFFSVMQEGPRSKLT